MKNMIIDVCPGCHEQTSDINKIKSQEVILNDKNLAGAACLTKSVQA